MVIRSSLSRVKPTLWLSMCILTCQGCGDFVFTGGTIEQKTMGLVSDELPRTVCDKAPLTEKAGVMTILLALGDKDNLPSPTVNQVAAKSIAEKAIQLTTPVSNPRVLVVLDRNHGGESIDDYRNLYENLLSCYKPDRIEEPESGLLPSHLNGYDVIWFVNPGEPLSSSQTKQTLKTFTGGLVLSGDDMAENNSELTGLNYYETGDVIGCGILTFAIDRNTTPIKYAVSLNNSTYPELDGNQANFIYGNDIDTTSVARGGVEVLATAKGNYPDCSQQRPVIVRYLK